ncbi:efflux RND transporter periplasmic adaptor subunit [Halomonas sp. NO4]|uniref:efflux RND transporter periplasmic adaptor subunit n=1 Tax=Halomonas sp. NO4 TaxID=2484813 RepID=UPI0013D8A7CE|nr:efflux RND transporter periplasmic adaptor subunit [Halomonas sp. NO4]
MPRRPPSSYLLAVALLLGLLLWLAFGDLQRFQRAPPPAEEGEGTTPTRVEYRLSEAEAYAPRLIAQGQLEPVQELALRVQRAGRVAALPVAQGADVAEGETLLRLAPEALEARLAQAEDALARARAELAGAEELRRRELISQPELLRRRAEVSAGAAELAELGEALDQTRPAAPFAGVFDRLDVERGEVLQPGETFGRLVDDRQLTASAWIAQREALDLAPGLAVEATLLDGSRLSGELTHVARRADSATRTFHVEATLDNPERRRLAGASASLAITREARAVHRLSLALLVLDDSGALAVKHLDSADRVVVTRVTLVDAGAEAARVAGLPERVRLITLGGGFVAAGERVEAVAADGNGAGAR